MSTAEHRATAQALTLYEIADEFQVIFEWLEENEGELTPELEELLERMEGTLEEKVQRIYKVRRMLTLSQENTGREIDRLRGLKNQQEKHINWLDSYVTRTFDQLGKVRVDTPVGKVGIRANSAVRVLEPESLDGVDPQFIYQPPPPPPVLDKPKLLDALKRAEKVPAPGTRVEFGGVVVERGRHVRYW